MTTIVWRDGILAADTRAYSGSKTVIGLKSKIHRLHDGRLIGCSTSKVGVSEKLIRLVREHGTDFTFEDEIPVQAMVINGDGSFFYFNDQDGFSGPIRAEYAAIGSGEDFALGALKMGTSAVKAVEIACELDVWSGGEIETLSLAQ